MISGESERNMATLERRYDGCYRIAFYYQGKRFKHSIGKVADRDARSCKDRLEENLRFLERGLLEVPPDADLGVFLVSGGRLNGKPVLEKPLTLAEYFERYQRSQHPGPAQGNTAGSKEANSCYTEKIHIKHFLRVLGRNTIVRTITPERMQEYVNTRSNEKGRHGRHLSHATIKKEIGTFATVWNNWACPLGLVSGPAPTRRLIFHKRKSKPPFQTWQQIERQIARGGVSKSEQKDLWNNLFLTVSEIQQILDHVRAHAHRKYAQVMFCFTAFTGARRSEMLRSRIDDFDFAGGTVTIREKKRDRSKEFTFRTVPLAPALQEVMEEWFRDHPGGNLTICKRPNESVTVQMAAKAFRLAVDDSKWKVLPGWHVFRHSFASNCALKGIDQRVIDKWLGHQTEEMRLRYQHLFPDQQQQAIRSVFA
jgi:integrase